MSAQFAARPINGPLLIGVALLAGAALAVLRGGLWLVAGPLIAVIVVIAVFVRPEGTILVVDADGVHDRRLGIPMIPWRYVERIDRVSLQGALYINLHLNVTGEEFVELPLWRRMLTPLLGMLGIAPIHIVASGLNAAPIDVFAAIFNAYTAKHTGN